MQKISDYSINKITKTLENKFDLSTFVAFINDILNTNFNLQDTVNISEDKYRQHIGNISSFKRVGTFKDPGNTLIDVLVVTLKKRTTLENARAIQRNLVAGYLSSFPEVKNGAIVAFNSPDSLDWRLSFVKMDFILDGGKVRKELSPAKRYSYLVGPNENCHTAESRFASLIDADTQPTLNQIEDLFSVEKVTAKFFDEYRQLFELLVANLKQNHTFLGIADKNHINTENFAKTLLGQIVFLYFVQKKGWLGANKGQSLNNGDRKFLRHLFEKADSNSTNYFNDWLEPLFYDALNNPKRSGVNSNYIDRFDGQIPFLNGGLFEPKYDWQNTFVIIDNQIFFKILEVFDRYNFTVKEDDPLDKEVAIDPEMLGKIFENLLEENLRKGKGTYYTPREIVHYMCKESLINYLSSSQPSIDKEIIRKLISWNGESWNNYITFDSSQVQKLKQSLSEVKIVDPACGSGAFLVGMLNEIVKARFLIELCLGSKPSLYQLKKSTIQSSIHGVDIDPGAIEIAKLRLWLSLVVDHELDEIEPLPNLDYKIMQGNSLVEDLILGDQSIKLFDPNAVNDKVPRKIMKNLFEEEPQTSLFTDINQESIFSKLKALQKEYFSQSDPSQKRKIRTQIEKIEGDAIRNCVSIEMRKLKEQKQNIKILPGIGIPPDELKRLQKIDNKENQIYSVLSELDKSGTKPYFLWHLYFHDVLAEKGGFDIVIANPPYVKEYTQRSAFDGIRKSQYYQGKMDLWYLFACQGIDLLKNYGIISLIAQNNWTTSFGASILREKVISDTQIVQLIDFGDYKIFDSAGIQTMVMEFMKTQKSEEYRFDYRKLIGSELKFADVLSILNYMSSDKQLFLTPKITRKIMKSAKLVFSDNNADRILNKVRANANFILDGNSEVAQGIVFPQDQLNRKNLEKLNNNYLNVGDGIYVINHSELKLIDPKKNELKIIKPYYTTSELFKYYGNTINKYWAIYTDSSFKNEQKMLSFPNLKKHLDKFKQIFTSDNKPYGLHRSRNEKFFIGEKIIVARKCIKPTFTYTDFDAYVSATFYVIKTNKVNQKYLTGLLNSQLIAFWLRHKGKMQGSNYQIDKEPLLELPLIAPDVDSQNSIVKLIDEIISIIKTDGYNPKDPPSKQRSLEYQIDQKVYELYGLTTREIEIIEERVKHD